MSTDTPKLSSKKRGRSSPLESVAQASKKVLSAVNLNAGKRSSVSQPDSCSTENCSTENVQTELSDETCTVLPKSSEEDKVFRTPELSDSSLSAIENIIAKVVGEKLKGIFKELQGLSTIAETVRAQERRIRDLEKTTKNVEEYRSHVRDLEKAAQFASNEYDTLKTDYVAVVSDVSALRDELASMKKSYSRVECEIRDLRKACEQRDSPLAHDPSKNATGHPSGVTETEILTMLAEERRQRYNETNVIISGLPEALDEDLNEIMTDLFPDIRLTVSPKRLGQLQSGQVRPRLVKVVASKEQKSFMMSKKTGLTYHGTALYLNHDLTKAQRERRKVAVPVFKELRKAGVACSLPFDRILLSGKPATEHELKVALEESRQTSPQRKSAPDTAASQ